MKVKWNNFKLMLGTDHVWYIFSSQRNQYQSTGCFASLYDKQAVLKRLAKRGIKKKDWLDCKELRDRKVAFIGENYEIVL